VVLGLTSFQAGGFELPPERKEYIDAKATLDPNDPKTKPELIKKLMQRAVKSYPLMHALQTEAQSIDRLYRRGMLTDDIHSRTKQFNDFIKDEVEGVRQEAEELMPNFGATIWQDAGRFYGVSLPNPCHQQVT
jgi:Preprotein translocase subunit Sec66